MDERGANTARAWLAGLMAWQRHAPDSARPLLARLYRKHHAELPEADEAVREVWAALDEADVLAEYEAWRARYQGASHWPTREADERMRRTPAR